ncbi:FAD-binding protein [Palleronia sp. KMU-117]|uniref:FAD-binding protein n=1 Tax=Palleronia sp. KMU-117 TaxID=3434108 RepID=UPI003D714764
MTPKDETELADAVAQAKGPLRIRGGGTRPVGRVAAADTLSVAGLAGVTLYEPGALTIVARAGTPLADVEDILSAEGQRLPFEPMDHRRLLGTEGTPTIGGVVAANVSGPRRVQAGACRDSLIGVRFVDGGGTVITNGGRVMKNVTGYDLVKLMAGSWGTLGVLTEVSFKVLPAAEAVATVLIGGLDAGQAVAVMTRALRSPFEVSGAAYAATGPDGSRVAMLRIEGFAESVRYRAEKLVALLGDAGEIRIESNPDRVRRIWTWVRDAERFAGTPGDVWRLSVKPTDAARVADRLGAEDLLLDWGGSLIWAEVPPGTDLRGRLAGIAGHATRVRGAGGGLPAFHPEPAPLAALAAGLRAKFDPRGILNPGIMG